MFTRHISDTIKIESTLIIRCKHSGYSIDVKTKNTYICDQNSEETCSLFVKIISDGENSFTQNKYNKLQKNKCKKFVFFCKK